jgi:hypothetical protein
MPTPSWLTLPEVPVNADGNYVIKIDQLEQILTQFYQWRGDVAAGGRSLNGLGNLGLAGSITSSVNQMIIKNANSSGLLALCAGTGIGAGGASIRMIGSTYPSNQGDFEFYSSASLVAHLKGDTGNLGLGGTPPPGYALYILRPTTLAEIYINTPGTNADTGIRITDAVRGFKQGLNVGTFGVGRYNFFNLNAGRTMFAMGDDKVWLWVDGAIREVTRDASGFLKAT